MENSFILRLDLMRLQDHSAGANRSVRFIILQEMTMKKYIMTLTIIGVMMSFFGILPTSGEGMSNTYQLSNTEGCFAVTGSINQFPDAEGNLAGPISGDLLGNVLTTAGPTEIHGIVVFRDVVQYWEITGGNVEALIGRRLVFENNFRGIINNYPILKVNTTGILVEGAEKGSITLHGWTRLVEPIENYLEYHGVICP
jgi:hypothetical protein